MAKLKITIEPLFIIALFLFIFFGWIDEVLFYLVALACHEYSHYFVAKKLGYSLNSITFSPFGASLNGSKNYFKKKDEILISLAGPLCNLALAIFFIALWWLFPTTYLVTYFFVLSNISLFIFNMLPLFPLDAGRILIVLLKGRKNFNKLFKLYKINSILIAIILILFFIHTSFTKVNLSLLFIAFLLVMSIYDMKKDLYYQYSFLDKTKEDYSKILENKIYIVPADSNIYELVKFINKNTYSTFKIVDKSGKIIKEIDEKTFLNSLNKGNIIGRN